MWINEDIRIISCSVKEFRVTSFEFRVTKFLTSNLESTPKSLIE